MAQRSFTRQQEAEDVERSFRGYQPKHGAYSAADDGEYGGKGPVNFPADHQFGMRVPQGGSMCANCEYLADDGESCRNPDFAVWLEGVGTKPPVQLPAPADEYCCDLYEPGEGDEDDETADLTQSRPSMSAAIANSRTGRS